MQRAIAFLSIAAVLLFAGAAFASDVASESAQYAGHAYVDASTGNVTWGTPLQSPAAGSDIYSNILSPAIAAISSTSLASVWGDRVTTVGTGVWSEQDFTIYNSGSSAGPLLTATVAVNAYNYATSALIGGFTTNINFGVGGLPAGFYTIVTVTGIDPLVINLNVNDIVVTQNITAKTGTANRLGVALLDPVTIGLSLNTMYINSSTVGPAGYYTVGTGNANPGYRINALQAVPTQPSTWGKVKSLYR
jgi:hypothetical protein